MYPGTSRWLTDRGTIPSAESIGYRRKVQNTEVTVRASSTAQEMVRNGVSEFAALQMVSDKREAEQGRQPRKRELERIRCPWQVRDTPLAALSGEMGCGRAFTVSAQRYMFRGIVSWMARTTHWRNRGVPSLGVSTSRIPRASQKLDTGDRGAAVVYASREKLEVS